MYKPTLQSSVHWLDNECKTLSLLEFPNYKRHPTDRCCINDQCQFCNLQKKVHLTSSWFKKLDRKNQQAFLLRLIALCNSVDILNYLIQLLSVVDTKDSFYTLINQNLIPSQRFWKVPLSVKFDAEKTSLWFLQSNAWTKTNFLLLILCQADLQILRTVRNKMQIYYLIRLQNVKDESLCYQYDKGEFGSSISHTLQDEKKFLNQCTHLNIFPSQKALKVTQHKVKTTVGKVKLDKLPDGAKELRTGTIFYNDTMKELLNEAKTTGLFEVKIGPYLIMETDNEEILHPEPTWLNIKMDFSKILPLPLIIKIVDYLDYESLLKCVQIGGSLKIAAEIILRKRKLFTLQPKLAQIVDVNESVAIIPLLTFDLDPDFACQVMVSIPVIDPATCNSIAVSEKDSVDDENSQIVYFADILSNIKTRPVAMQVRNIYCKPYTRHFLVEKYNLNRVVHFDGCNLIAIAEYSSPIEFFCSRTLKRVNLTLDKCYMGCIRCLYVAHRDRLVFAAGNEAIRCWSIKNGRCRNTFVGHSNPILCLAVCGNRLAAGSTDGVTKLWNYLGDKYIFTFRDDHAVTSVALNYFLCITGCEGGKIRVYDALTGIYMKQMNHKDKITCIRANRWLISSASRDGLVAIWSTQGKVRTCLMQFPHPSEVTQVELYFLRLITGCKDGKIRIWDIGSRRLLKYIYPKHVNIVSPILSFHLSKERIIVNTEAEVVLLNFDSTNRSCSPQEKTSFKTNKRMKPEQVNMSLSAHAVRLLKSLLKNIKSHPDPNTPASTSLYHIPVQYPSLNFESSKKMLKTQRQVPIELPVPESFYSIISKLKNPTAKPKSLPKSRSDNRLVDPMVAKEVTCRAFMLQTNDKNKTLPKGKSLYLRKPVSTLPRRPLHDAKTTAFADSCRLFKINQDATPRGILVEKVDKKKFIPLASKIKSVKQTQFSKPNIYVHRKAQQPIRYKVQVHDLFTTTGGECEETKVQMWPKVLKLNKESHILEENLDESQILEESVDQSKYVATE